VLAATITISGKYDIVWVTPTAHTYCVQNDVWGADTPQTLQVNYQTGAFTVTVAGHTKSTSGSPASFPSIFKGNHWGTTTSGSGMPIQVRKIANVSTSWNFSTVSSGAWNCVYDIWFHKTGDYAGGSPNGAELMIWLNKMGAIQPAGSKVATVSVAGATWDVWYTTMGWNYIAYVGTSFVTSASFDIKTFINDCVSRGYIGSSWYLIGVEAGFELWQNGAGLASNSFSATVEASPSGPIYINSDGSISPVTAPIFSADNITYMLADDIYDSIIVERDNIVLDGAGYTLQGAGSGTGIDLTERSNVTIKNMEIKQFDFGIYLNHSSSISIIENVFTSITFEGIRLYESSNNSIITNNVILNDVDGITLYGSSNNNITQNYLMSNYDGIRLYESSNNSITENIVIENYYGISLSSSSGNNIISNNVTANNGGISLYWSSNENRIVKNHVALNTLSGLRLNESSNNHIYHNNFVDNIEQVHNINSTNVWDDGYPSGGNYWSNYTGIDANIDGIGDSSYEIDSMNIDHYPLMGTFSDFSVSSEEQAYHVTTVCNSTISAFEFDQVDKIIRFNVTGEDGIGFCRVCIPHDLMEPPYTVTVDGYAPLYVNYTLDNGTHGWIYFTYQHSTHKIEIVPEFPTWTSMLIILIILTAAIAVYKRRLPKTPIQ